MAFWGVEVKPGRPYTHPPSESEGRRLHISQATLGNGESAGKVVLQCNVGNKRRIFLCSLVPNRSESCQLNLEFNEAEEVVFSAIGPRAVHITGYYVGYDRSSHIHEGLFVSLTKRNREPSGEDIADTESEKSMEDDDYYDLSDSFIDDSDPSLVSNTSSEGEGQGRRRNWILRVFQSSDEEANPEPNKVAEQNEETPSSDSEAVLSEFFVSMNKKQKGLKLVDNNDDPQENGNEKKLKDAGSADGTSAAPDGQSSPANGSASPGLISKKKRKKNKQREESHLETQ